MSEGSEAHRDPPVHEGHIEVARTARYSQMGELGRSTRQLWFVCHGYRQLASRFIHPFFTLADLGVVVVAPEALSRFYIENAPGRHGNEARIGATWMTRADRENEIRDYVRYLDKLAESVRVSGDGSAPRVVVLGFSQGVHTAARWVALGTTRVDELILWGAYLPPDLDAARLAGIGVTQVYGEADPTADPNLARSEVERLKAAGIAPRRVAYEGGHRLDPRILRGLAEGFGP